MNLRDVARDAVVPNLDAVRLVVGTALLAYASATDLRTRRVRNATWLVGGGVGLVLLAGDYALGRPFEAWPLLLIPIVMAVTYGLWYVHLIAGGADAKAIMMLAILVPFPIDLAAGARSLPLWTSPLPPAFVVFANSLLVFLVIPFLFLGWNLSHGAVRFPSMFLGYRVSVDRAAKSFVWVTERVDPAGRVRQVLFSSKQSPEEQAANLEALRRAGRTHVWVTPKIPFMVPLLGGFLTAFFVGDVLTHWVTLAVSRLV